MYNPELYIILDWRISTPGSAEKHQERKTTIRPTTHPLLLSVRDYIIVHY